MLNWLGNFKHTQVSLRAKVNRAQIPFMLLASLALTSCAAKIIIVEDPLASTTSDGTCAETQSVTVSALYTIAPNWNDYAKTSNTTLACVGTETGFHNACLHGGERRQITLTDQTSCSSLTYSDALGVFQWKCQTVSGGVQIYSTGLKPEYNLSDLIESSGTAFKSNSITVRKSGCTVAKSASAIWWTNTVQAAPDSSAATQALSSSGTIYTISGTQTSRGYNLAVDKVALVGLAGSKLVSNGLGSGCNSGTGKIAAADLLTLICGGQQKHLWIEGNYVGDSTFWGQVYLVSVKFSRLRNLKLVVNGTNGIAFNGSTQNFATNLEVTGATATGLFVYGSSAYNVFHDIRAYNNSTGIWHSFSNYPIYTQVQVANNVVGWKFADATYYGSVSHVTAVNNTTGFYTLQYTTNDAYSNFLLANNNWGYSVNYMTINSTNNRNANFAAVNNALGINLDRLNNTTWSGSLLFGNNTADCSVNLGTNPGLVNGTCVNQGTSTATRAALPKDATNAFVGKVTTTDAANGSNTNGAQAFAGITDWLNFDNPFRAWGKNGSAFPNADHQTNCTAGTCQIWDFRLKSTDDQFLNRIQDGNNANDPFVVGETCPDAADGNVTLTNFEPSPRTYLLNAMEVFGSGGNDNGLCESNETCVFTPNFGAYQGSGSYWDRSCTFHDGTVTGVTLLGYPTNGA